MAGDKDNTWTIVGGLLAAAVVFGGGTTATGAGPASASEPRAASARPIPGGPMRLADVPYAALFRREGREHGVSPVLLAAVAKAESDYRPHLVSHAGARGLMQIMPGTARGLGVNPDVPAQAVDGAARLLARHLRTYHGNVDLTLAAYNAGQGAVRKHGGVPPLAETRTYIKRVKRYMRQLAAPSKEK